MAPQQPPPDHAVLAADCDGTCVTEPAAATSLLARRGRPAAAHGDMPRSGKMPRQLTAEGPVVTAQKSVQTGGRLTSILLTAAQAPLHDESGARRRRRQKMRH